METKQEKSSADVQFDLIMLPKLGNTMASYCQINEDGSYIASEYFYVEALDGKEMNIRLRHCERNEVREGKFINLLFPNNSRGIIFRDDIKKDSFPTVYTEIEF